MSSFRQMKELSRLLIAILHLKLFSFLRQLKTRKTFVATYTMSSRFWANLRVRLENTRVIDNDINSFKTGSKSYSTPGSSDWIRRQIDQSGFRYTSNYFLPPLRFDLKSIDNQETFIQKGFAVSDDYVVSEFFRNIRYQSHQITSIKLNDTFFKEGLLYNDVNFLDFDQWSSPVLDSSYGLLNPTLSGYKNKNVVFGNFEAKNSEFVAGEFAYIFGRYINNYWHFLFEYLPKLLMLNDTEIVIIPGNLELRNEKFLLNYLDVLGLKHLKLDLKKTYKFEKLHIPTSPVVRLSDFEYSIDGALLKKHKVAIRNIDELDTKFSLTKNKIVFLTRHSPRRVILDSELQKLAKDNGFLVINPASLSIAQQAAMFNNAKAIISYPGSVWANLIFASPLLQAFNIASPILERASLHQIISMLSGSDFIDIQIKNYDSGDINFVNYSMMDRHRLQISRAVAESILETIKNFLNLK